MRDIGAAAPSEAAVQPAPPYVIRSAEDARALLRRANHRRPVVVAAAGLGAAERARWGARLGFWANACGCHLGALFALVALAVCVVRLPGSTEQIWTILVVDAGVVLTAAVVGKLTGIAAARLMLALDVRRLAGRIAVAEDG